MNYLLVDRIIKNALEEDRVYEDITTLSIVKRGSRAQVELIAKEEGVLCGLDVFTRTFEILGDVRVVKHKEEGEEVKVGDIVALIEGDTRVLLTGERVALNFLQRMSGVATLANRAAVKLRDYGIKVMDTRKTTPGLRYLEKYAVSVGGGNNHRFDLSDMSMIKDNHILAAGGIGKAIEAVRGRYPFIKKIEVEVEDLQGLEEALEGRADIIMLDNMETDTIRRAVEIIDGRAIVEVSGNMTLERLEELRGIGIDYVSMGKLTHSARALDLSMKNLRIVE
jgi:nicotinate-nucleotide pyrophosphorylase